jgi:hypothetical protein
MVFTAVAHVLQLLRKVREDFAESRYVQMPLNMQRLLSQPAPVCLDCVTLNNCESVAGQGS